MLAFCHRKRMITCSNCHIFVTSSKPKNCRVHQVDKGWSSMLTRTIVQYSIPQTPIIILLIHHNCPIPINTNIKDNIYIYISKSNKHALSKQFKSQSHSVVLEYSSRGKKLQETKSFWHIIQLPIE